MSEHSVAGKGKIFWWDPQIFLKDLKNWNKSPWGSYNRQTLEKNPYSNYKLDIKLYCPCLMLWWENSQLALFTTENIPNIGWVQDPFPNGWKKNAE